MSFQLTAAQWERIHAFQAAEIERFASDAAFAKAMASEPHFSCVGQWLNAEHAGRALEIGCGPGRYVAMLASVGYDVVGADPVSYPSWEMLRKSPKITLTEGVSAEALPYPDASFDAVACMGALLYFKDADRAVSEIRRVLKPGGRLVVRTVNRTNLYRRVHKTNIDPATVNVYTEEELAAFLSRHGFDVARTFSYGFYPPVLISRWWRLSNGGLGYTAQQFISDLCPRSLRVSVNAFATRKP